MPFYVVDTQHYIRAGGLAASGWTGTDSFSGSTVVPGRTVLRTTTANKIRQDTNIARAWVRVITIGAALGFKFKVFRVNGANYDFVGESQLFTPTRQGLQELVFTTPIAVLQGDICGIFVQGHATVAADRSVVGAFGTGMQEDGDITATQDFTTSVASTAPQVEMLCRPPFLAVAGDSWVSGHTATIYNNQGATSLHFTGPRASEVPYQMNALSLMPGAFEFQSYGLGSQLMAWVASTAAPAMVNTRAPAILIMGGGNDAFTDGNWAGIDQEFDTIKALLMPHQHLFISEIGPGQRYSDVRAAEVRNINSNLATWCANNNATLIQIHTALGTNRVSTGFPDDIHATYNYDGAHLNQAGVDKLADLWADAITAYYTANPIIANDPVATNSIPIPTVLDSASSLVSSTTMASISLSPAANSLLIVGVGNGTGSGTLTPVSMADTFSGGSLTWTKQHDMQGTGSGIYGAALFTAVTGASPGSGVITATWNVAGTRKNIIVLQIPLGVKLAAPIVQAVEVAANTNAGTVTLTATPATDSMVIGLAHSRDDANKDIYPATVFTQLAESSTNGGSNETTLMFQFKNLNAPAAVVFDGMNNTNNILMALEVAAKDNAFPFVARPFVLWKRRN